MNAVGIIPARYASSRFPGKPLSYILGKPMIQWVYEQAKRARLLTQVIVATDDQRIFDTVDDFGGNVVMTSSAAANGTERIAEVASDLNVSFIANIQGDEPLIDPAAIDQLVTLLRDHPETPVGTLAKQITRTVDLMNPNIPKVVLDKNFNALYFSRSMIPFNRDEQHTDRWLRDREYYKHIGMYIYQRDFLLELVKLPPSDLEQIEKLEQLRILEYGYKIKVALTDSESIGVDIPEDIQRVIAQLNRRTA